jgi:hypothetical protein
MQTYGERVEELCQQFDELREQLYEAVGPMAWLFKVWFWLRKIWPIPAENRTRTE